MGTLKSTLTLKARIEIHEKLKEVIIPLGDGTCTYKDGWNDRLVAERFKCVENNVAGVRREMFGGLKKATTTIATGIEERLTQIEDFLTSKWPDWKDHLDPDLFSKGGK